MLANPTYIGTAFYGHAERAPSHPVAPPTSAEGRSGAAPYSIYRTEVADQLPIAVPAIIDEPLFEAARERLAADRRRKRTGVVGATVLLQGLLVCARCGYAYHGSTSHGGTPHTYRYYRCGGTCPSRFGGQKVCQRKF